MEVTGSTSTTVRTDLVAEGTYDPYADLGFEEFMDLLIAELTNQDPMEPTSNADLMNQIGQIREIASTDQLANTLDAVMLSQSLATAGNAVNKVIDGLSDEGDRICGTVTSVAIEEGEAILQVEDKDGELHSVTLNNLANIYPEGTSLPTPGYLEFVAESGETEAETEAEADTGAVQGDSADEVEESDTETEEGTTPATETENESTGDDTSSSEENTQTAA